MKLDINDLERMAVPEEVETYMTAHGGNHQQLIKSWNEPDTEIFGKDLNLLALCLSHVLQQKPVKKAVVNRLRGRIQKIRNAEEIADFAGYLNPIPEFLS